MRRERDGRHDDHAGRDSSGGDVVDRIGNEKNDEDMPLELMVLQQKGRSDNSAIAPGSLVATGCIAGRRSYRGTARRRAVQGAEIGLNCDGPRESGAA